MLTPISLVSFCIFIPLESPGAVSNATSVSSPGIPPPPPAPPTTPQGGIAVSSNGIPVPPPPPAPPLPGQPSSSQIQLRRVNWEKLQTDKLDGTIWRQVIIYIVCVCVLCVHVCV